MKQFRIQLVIAFIVLICGVSLMGVIYIVFNKPAVAVNPGVVVTHPSPFAMPHIPYHSVGRMRTAGTASVPMLRSEIHGTPAPSLPSNVAMPVWTSSSAKIHTSGSGIGSSSSPGAPVATGRRSSQYRGIQPSTAAVAMPMTTFIAMADVRMVAAPAAQEAPQMAKMASVRNAPPPPNPTDLEEENQLVEHPLCPIGDAVIPLLLLAIGWGIYKRKKDPTNMSVMRTRCERYTQTNDPPESGSFVV